MTTKKPKTTIKPEDATKSPSDGRHSVNSDGYVEPSPRSRDSSSTNNVADDDPMFDELADMQETLKNTQEGQTINGIFSKLSLKEQIALLTGLSISKKFDGTEPFSDEDLEYMRSNKGMDKFATAINKTSPFAFPHRADDTEGFRPNSDNFLPRENSRAESSFRPTRETADHFDSTGNPSNTNPSTTFAGQSQNAIPSQFNQPGSTQYPAHPNYGQQQHNVNPTGSAFYSPHPFQQHYSPSFGVSPPAFNHNGGVSFSSNAFGSVLPGNNPPPHGNTYAYTASSASVPHGQFSQQVHPAANLPSFAPPANVNTHGGTSAGNASTGFVSSGNNTAPGVPPVNAPPSAPFPAGLPTGFAFRPARTNATYEADRVLISRYNRGTPSNEKERAKIRELCTKPIQPVLDSSSVKKLLTSDDTPYDISEDASHWQDGITNIWHHAVAYDFKHILLIPEYFDPTDGLSIPANVRYINAVLDHNKVTDQMCFAWQLFVRRFGRGEEITSDQWFEEKLWKSLGPTLLSEVRSDFHELPDDYKGGISLLRLIINRVVQTSQETRRAMEEYIKTFDIRNFPGEDVTEATLRIKAIARSIGKDQLPKDIVHRVLEGFANASTPAFQSLCHHKESMLSTSLLRHGFQTASLYTQLVSVLQDLETKFIDLRSGRRWLGVGHGSSATKSVFYSANDDDDSGTDDDSLEQEYAAYKVHTGKQAVSFDVWVRDKTCHHCGEVGHIRGKNCPKFVSDVFAGRVPPPRQRTRPHRPQRPCEYASRRPHNTSPPDHKLPTHGPVKQDARRTYSASHENNHASPASSSPSADYDAASSTANPTNHSGFLAALGCPKN